MRFSRRSTRASRRYQEYWDALVTGASQDDLEQQAVALDSLDIDLMRRIRASRRRSLADPGFIDKLETTVMETFIRARATPIPIRQGIESERRRRNVLPTRLPDLVMVPESRTRWIVAQSAVVLLLILTLALGYFALRDSRPAAVPATPTVTVPAAPTVSTYRGDVSRTGEMPGPAPVGRPGVLWRVEAADRIASAITVANGIAYVGSDDGVVHAIDVSTGVEVWTFETGPEVGSPFTIIDGDTVYAVGGDGMAHALNAGTGAEIWSSDPSLLLSNQATLADDTLFVGGQNAQYFALDKTDGRLIWTATLGGVPQSRGTVFLDDTLYFGADDGKAYALNGETGETRWTFDSGMEIVKSVSAANGMVFLPAGNVDRNDAVIIAVSAETGAEVWRHLSDGQVVSSGTPFGESLLVGFSSGQLKSLNLATGEVNWTYLTGNGQEIGAGSSIVDGIAYFVSVDYSLYAVDATTGVEVWRVQLDDSMNMSPAITGGVIYVGTFAGGIYALGQGGAALASDATPIASPVSAQGTPLPVMNSATSSADVSPVTLLWETDGTSDRIAWQVGMTVAPDGSIWLSDAVNAQFLIYSSDGAYLETWGTAGSGEGQFVLRGPRGDGFGDVVFNPDGSFYVLDPGNYRIQAFDKDRTFLHSWGSNGSGESQFYDLIGIDVDANGVVYALDGGRGDVQTFSPDGTLLETIELNEEFYGTNSMNGITLDKDGNMFIGANGDGIRHFEQLMEYDRQGNLVQVFRIDSGPGKLLDQVNSVAIDAAGNVYAATERGDGRVVVFRSDGTYLTSIKVADVSGVAIPFSVDLDDNGSLYVADGTTLRLAKFKLNAPLWPLDAATPTS